MTNFTPNNKPSCLGLNICNVSILSYTSLMFVVVDHTSILIKLNVCRCTSIWFKINVCHCHGSVKLIIKVCRCKTNNIFWIIFGSCSMVNICRCEFFGHVPILTFVVVKVFRSYSNHNFVKCIWWIRLQFLRFNYCDPAENSVNFTQFFVTHFLPNLFLCKG